MKTIVCTGDSHTCGQGATGFYTDLDGAYNTAGKGIGRNMAFDGKGYVNLLRDGICRLTHSSAYEILPQSLDGQGKYSAQSRLLKLCGPLSVLASGDLALVLLGETQSPAVADIYVNQKPYKTLRLETKAPRYDGFSFKYVPVFCEGGGRIEIVPRQGEVFAGHILVFCGAYAVVNSGVGSCPCGRYLSECFDDGVEVFRPDLIVCEAHTINDWLLGKSPKEYEKSLTKLLQKMKRTARAVVLVTVSPILGEQAAPFNQTPYHEFVATARRAAKSEGVFFADANRKMADFLAGRTEREQQELFFADNWHVNDLGHRMYAECILEVLEKENLL